MMSPGMQKLKTDLMNTETPSMGRMKKEHNALKLGFCSWGLGFCVGFFSLEIKEWRTE